MRVEDKKKNKASGSDLKFMGVGFCRVEVRAELPQMYAGKCMLSWSLSGNKHFLLLVQPDT